MLAPDPQRMLGTGMGRNLSPCKEETKQTRNKREKNRGEHLLRYPNFVKP